MRHVRLFCNLSDGSTSLNSEYFSLVNLIVYSGSHSDKIQQGGSPRPSIRSPIMKAYSLDLRQKVIDAYNHNEGSQRQLAKRFSVSLSFIQDLLKRYREAGTIASREHGGGPTAKLNAEQVMLVARLIEDDNDAILVELCERLEQQNLP